jgi:hypothetical protein
LAPSASQSHIASVPSRVESNAILVPSGEKLGSLSVRVVEWLTVRSRVSVTRSGNAIPKRLAADLLKDNPGRTKYRVEVQVGGQQTFLDQIAVSHFETRNSYDVREFYESTVKEHMPFSPGEIRGLATERRIHLEEDRSVASLRGRLPVRDLNFDLGREGGTLLAPLER